MMQTLIGCDGVVLTLSGRLEIFAFSDQVNEPYCGEMPARDITVIHASPGIGVQVQAVILPGWRILDVETLETTPRPVVTVKPLLRNGDDIPF